MVFARKTMEFHSTDPHSKEKALALHHKIEKRMFYVNVSCLRCVCIISESFSALTFEKNQTTITSDRIVFLLNQRECIF